MPPASLKGSVVACLGLAAGRTLRVCFDHLAISRFSTYIVTHYLSPGTTQFSEQLCRTAGVTDLPTPTCPDSASSNGTAATSSMATSMSGSASPTAANASASASASSSATGADAAAASSTGSANNLMAHGMGALGAAVVGAVALM